MDYESRKMIADVIACAGNLLHILCFPVEKQHIR